MANKPIVFSGPDVRALLSGRKDVTRRLMNPQPPVDAETCHHNSYSGPEGPAWWWFNGTGAGEKLQCWPEPGKVVEPRYRKGDMCWVQEAWRTFEIYDGLKPSELLGRTPTPSISYLERPGNPSIHWGRYRPARFMCRWMSRLWLRVTEDPYPERVRDITEEEAIREGVESAPRLASEAVDERAMGITFSYRAGFCRAWKSLHGPNSWAWDWVWRYAFEREAERG